MFYHFESLGAKVIILLIVMAKQTAFLHKKTAMCHAAAVLPVCMTFANYKITHIYNMYIPVRHNPNRRPFSYKKQGETHGKIRLGKHR